MAFVSTSPFPRSHHEHQSSDSVFHPPGVVLMARVPRNPANSDTGRKRKLDDLDRRLTQAENQLTRHNDRLDNVELRLELDQSYRFIRVEACKGLEEMFAKVETGEVSKSDIRDVVGQTLTREIREVLERQHDEGALQQASQTHGNNRRKLPTAVQRKLVFDGLNLCPLIEWCSKAGNSAYSVRLTPGEPSRLAHEAIRTTLNWSLYIYSKFASEGDSKLQVYPDRGPKQRAKGKGKGQGKGKPGGAKGNGKGGKGKRDRDSQEG